MSNTVRVAAVQMTCHLGDKAANLVQAEVLLADLAGQVDIICLPELFSTGYHLDVLGERLFDLAEPVPVAPGQESGPTATWLCALAGRLNLAIIAGLVERDQLATIGQATGTSS